jgi:hypothetical protein
MICERCGASYSGSSGCPICKPKRSESPEWDAFENFDSDPTAEAMILGNIPDEEEWGEASVTSGVIHLNGRALPVAYYAAQDPALIVGDDMVPYAVKSGEQGTTPFEDVILAWVDGTSPVSEIVRGRALSAQAIKTTLLALAERGVIAFRGAGDDYEIIGEVDDVDDEVTDEHAAAETSYETPRPEPEPVEQTLESVPSEPVDSDPVVQEPPALNSRAPESAPPLLNAQYLLSLSPAPDVQDGEPPAPIHVAEPPPMATPKLPAAKPAVERRVSRAIEPIPAKPVAKPVVTSRAQSRARPGAATPAEKLYQQALEDKAAGNYVSAYTNIKLALVFDRQNKDFVAMFDEMAAHVAEMTKGESPVARAAALFERAIREEGMNNTDEAVKLLEEALTLSKDAQYFNRLGVILAMRRREFERGRELIMRAVELSPSNRTYHLNLDKVSRMAEKSRMRESEPNPPKKSGIFGLFGKRR